MRNYIVKAIQIVAVIMFVGGIIMFFVSKHNAWEAGLGFYTRDTSAVSMWNFFAVQSIATVISSVFVFGFSYIVEAACRYLDRCDQEDYDTQEEQ